MSHQKSSEYASDVFNLRVDLQADHPEVVLLKQLSTTGCAVLSNHNVPVNLLKEIIEEWSRFFASNDKHHWLRTDETDEGFIPVNIEAAKKNEIADYKELYQTHYKGQYPANVNIKLTTKLFDAIVALGGHLFSLLDIALPNSVKSNLLTPLPKMVRDSNNHLIRIIHYPPIERGVNIPRAAPHTDICLFTIVFADTFNGLELQNQDGHWYEPPMEKNDLVVFNSEMLEIATNDFFKAVVHRVKANPNSRTDSRYSIPIGFHPLRNVELKSGLTAAQHLRNRLNEMGYDGDPLNLRDH